MVAALSFIAIGASVLGLGVLLQQAANAETIAGQMTFVTTRFGLAQIASSNLDGSNFKQLTTTPGQSYSPSVSPDGEKILFASDRDSPNTLFGIYAMKKDGTAVVRLTGPTMNAGTPSWAPDGKSIAFVAIAPGSPGFQVFTANADGTNQVRQTQGVNTQLPVFSPDGSKLAFVSITAGPITLPNGTTATGSRQAVEIIARRLAQDAGPYPLPGEGAIKMQGNTSYPAYLDATHLIVTSSDATGATAQLFTYDIPTQTAGAFTKAGTYATEANVSGNMVSFTTVSSTGVQIAWLPRAGGTPTVLALGGGDNYSGSYRPLVNGPASVPGIGTPVSDTGGPTLTIAQAAAGVAVVGAAAGGLYYFVKVRARGGVNLDRRQEEIDRMSRDDLEARIDYLNKELEPQGCWQGVGLLASRSADDLQDELSRAQSRLTRLGPGFQPTPPPGSAADDDEAQNRQPIE